MRKDVLQHEILFLLRAVPRKTYAFADEGHEEESDEGGDGVL